MIDPQTAGMDKHNRDRLPIFAFENPPEESEGVSLVDKKSDESRVEEPWTPGFRPRFPWIASLAIFLSFILAGLMALITIEADDSNVESWTISPPVLLAISSTAVNILIHVAMVKGAAITWWFLSMHPARRSRVQDLHWRWAAAGGLVDALKSMLVRGLSKTAIACSLATIMAVNAPLLQRALSVQTRESTSTGVHIGPIYAAHRLPKLFSANRDQAIEITTPSRDFSEITEQYLTRSPIVFTGDVAKLNGTYTSKLTAAGYHFNCTPEQITKLPVFVHHPVTIFISSILYQEHPWRYNLKYVEPWLTYPTRAPIYNEDKPARSFFVDLLWKPESGCMNDTHDIDLRVRNW
ncbi:hypothetical protein B0T21DRAFT_277011 [Apiosordaria backusii]|uniref:Uncharacterized protein n=1 Tax=Apiosordaria backusii TaxID=314023 RepID=A0AA40K6C4_9PEZI|nr:hypothetical protein B0T21DRAFT_277011 [Apiosordaria backusii]